MLLASVSLPAVDISTPVLDLAVSHIFEGSALTSKLTKQDLSRWCLSHSESWAWSPFPFKPTSFVHGAVCVEANAGPMPEAHLPAALVEVTCLSELSALAMLVPLVMSACESDMLLDLHGLLTLILKRHEELRVIRPHVSKAAVLKLDRGLLVPLLLGTLPVLVGP